MVTQAGVARREATQPAGPNFGGVGTVGREDVTPTVPRPKKSLAHDARPTQAGNIINDTKEGILSAAWEDILLDVEEYCKARRREEVGDDSEGVRPRGNSVSSTEDPRKNQNDSKYMHDCINIKLQKMYSGFSAMVGPATPLTETEFLSAMTLKIKARESLDNAIPVAEVVDEGADNNIDRDKVMGLIAARRAETLWPSKIDLRGLDLSGLDLRGIDFTNCDLSDANLEGAILKHADFTRAILKGTNFKDADLEGVDLL
ncbi:pentapeptide repeat-containing protein, partial [Rhizobium sp. PDO1-076]|uniref:pentapeptide repeat-containing protein n=1 Tax=Rhizobium sp. PDO1-076 TaxID=1125979 RepID=UPI00178C7F16